MKAKQSRQSTVHPKKQKIQGAREILEELLPKLADKPVGTFIAVNKKTRRVVTSKKTNFLDLFPFIEEVAKVDELRPFVVMRLGVNKNGEKCIVGTNE